MTDDTDGGQRPSILFVVCDCMSADVLTVPRYRRGVTFPDWFSVECTRMITGSTTTTPSFSTMLSGLYPPMHGVRLHHGHRLRPSVQTLPVILKEHGYRTVAEVSGPLFVDVGLDRGFDAYDYRDRTNFVSGDLMLEKRDNLVKLLREGEPAFAMLHIWDLHDPRYKYIKNRILSRAMNEKFQKVSFYDDYFETLKYIDQYLMGLLKALPDDTIVALTGDHGEMYQTHVFESLVTYLVKVLTKDDRFRSGHGSDVNLQLLEVPFLLRWSGGPSSRTTIDRVVRNADIMPTLLEAAAIELDHPVQGESILPLVKSVKGSNRLAYSEAGAGGLGAKEYLAFTVLDNHFQVRYYPTRKTQWEFWRVKGEKRLKAEGELFEMYKGILEDHLGSAVRADVRGMGDALSHPTEGA